MFSPSRSQSVHTNRICAFLACDSILLAIAFLSCMAISSDVVEVRLQVKLLRTSATKLCIGASNKSPAGQECHFLYRSMKSWFMMCPATHVKVTSHWPHCWNRKSNL